MMKIYNKYIGGNYFYCFTVFIFCLKVSLEITRFYHTIATGWL